MLAASIRLAELDAVYRTAPPPGRTCGQRWVVSPAPSFVIRCGAPPPEDTVKRASKYARLATILPSRPQLPPGTMLCPVATVSVAPPRTEIFLRIGPAKKAIH